MLSDTTLQPHVARLQRTSGDAAHIARETRAFIDAHLGEHITLQALAERLYVSRTRLCCAFKAETGVSVGAYLNDARMKRARELLRTTNLSIAEVAGAVGYARLGSFTEAFKEQTGVTPTAWRRNVLAQ